MRSSEASRAALDENSVGILLARADFRVDAIEPNLAPATWTAVSASYFNQRRC